MEQTQPLLIEHYHNLKAYNTFGVPTIAQSFVTITGPEQFQKLLDHPVYKNSKQCAFLGGGSNILFTKDRFDGLVIHNAIEGKNIENHSDADSHETSSQIHVTVGAGENRDEFVDWSIENNLVGVENLKSIPGSVGAAPIQNIGAYGFEAKDTISHVTYIDTDTGKSKTLTHEACQFGYRDSIFKHALKNKAFVTHVTFSLKQYSPESYTPTMSYPRVEKEATALARAENNGIITPKIIARTIKEIRASKLPNWKELGTAGSFFKNPIIETQKAESLQEKHPGLKLFAIKQPIKKSGKQPITQQGKIKSMTKLSAGQLIELTGLKGERQGAIGTYKNHALVIINYGDGTGKAIQAFAERIQEAVNKKFGIMLEPEVTYM